MRRRGASTAPRRSRRSPARHWWLRAAADVAPLTAAGSALLLAGSVCTRWSVYRAGFQSARDPVATLGPQRARIVRGERTRAR